MKLVIALLLVVVTSVVQDLRIGAIELNIEPHPINGHRSTHIDINNQRLREMMQTWRGKIADLEARNAQLERTYQDLLRECNDREKNDDTEKHKLEAELRELNSKLENALFEVQTLKDENLSQKLEIAAYRKLLEQHK